MKHKSVTSEVLKLTREDEVMLESLKEWLMDQKIQSFARRFTSDVMTCDGPSEDNYGWAGIILDYCKRFNVECPADFDLSREDWKYEHQLTRLIEYSIVREYLDQNNKRLVDDN